ncbi:MAG: NAD(P)H-hydrate dehydratase, partial [Oscillospiraceae bacterium]|nr:NAD(P)H-hydrate dehydratase [Oscillospiraceae bacterium]
GFRGKVDDFTSKIIEMVNKSSCKVYAVDVPSGFNADDGNCDEVGIKADITATFASAKVGHFTLPCKDSIGELVVCDIGISEDCLDNEGGEIYTVDYDMAYAPLKPREFNSNKGTYGKLLNISGSEEYKGAAYFSSAAAYKSGVGLVTLATTHDVTQVVATLSPETVYLPLDDEYNPILLLNKLKTSSACLIGCGLGTSSNAQKMLFDVVKNAQCPLVIDADGINILSKNIDVLKEKKAEIILTPHPGEMARLLGKSVEEICGNRFCEASFLAKRYGVIVVLKGQNTITALPDGKIYLNTTGNAGLAKAGSGDVLAGIISSFLAQGISPQNSAISGVYIHSLCADEVAKEISQYGMTASDLLMHLPKMFLCKNNF